MYYILFSEIELCHCAVPKLFIRDILRTVSNAGIYCSSDKVDTVYLIQYIFENSTVNINALFSSREDMACCSFECILMLLYADDNYFGNRSE
jgi:hypothetical protein